MSIKFYPRSIVYHSFVIWRSLYYAKLCEGRKITTLHSYNHIEVQVEGNFTSISFVHSVHVERWSQETHLLCSPESKDHLIHGGYVLDNLNGQLKIGCRTTPERKNMMQQGWFFFLMALMPYPLSLMPAPAGTESKCVPTCKYTYIIILCLTTTC